MTVFKSNKLYTKVRGLVSIALSFLVVIAPFTAKAAILGEDYTANGANVSVNLTASEGHISVGDGGSIYSWGYSIGGSSSMQLPGPTLIVQQGQVITVTLQNSLPNAAGNVSIVFPGHTMTSTSGGVPGALTQEAPKNGSVSYTFTATEPGTYQYHSGTNTDIQVEMGLYGALIVRPNLSFTPDPAFGYAGCAYDHVDSCFHRENLFMLSEIDMDVHIQAEMQANGAGPIEIAPGPYKSEYWFINGRAAPDTLAPAGTDVLTTQPYDSLAVMEPGEKLLLRLIGAGREQHPFHTHGNHAKVLAKDGRIIVNTANKLAGGSQYTLNTVPGGTIDAIFEWTGKNLGWDMYGHTPADGVSCIPETSGEYAGHQRMLGYDTDGITVITLATPPSNYNEWCGDHEREMPVELPSYGALTFGGFYSGSPYLGNLGTLPPGEGGVLGGVAGFTYMWHSHSERELVNNDVFPGGMLTLLVILAPNSL